MPWIVGLFFAMYKYIKYISELNVILREEVYVSSPRVVVFLETGVNASSFFNLKITMLCIALL